MLMLAEITFQPYYIVHFAPFLRGLCWWDYSQTLSKKRHPDKFENRGRKMIENAIPIRPVTSKLSQQCFLHNLFKITSHSTVNLSSYVLAGFYS